MEGDFVVLWKSKSLVISTLLVLLALSQSEAKEIPLSLDSAFVLAYQNNAQIQAVKAKLGVSDAQIKTAGARLNPSLLSDNGIAEKTYRLGIEQVVELGGKRHRRVGVAEANRNITKSEIETALLGLRYDVRKAYTDLYAAHSHLALLKDIFRVAQELVSIAKKREQAGDISSLEVLQADIVRVNAENEQQIALAAINQATNQLNSVLNQPLETQWTLSAPTAAPALGPANSENVLKAQVENVRFDLKGLLEQANRQRPELQKNAFELESVRQQKDLAKANRIPNVRIAAGPDYVAGSGSQFNAFIIGSVELLVLNRQQGPLAEAEAKRMLLERENTAWLATIQKEVSQAYNRLIMNQERIHRYETTILTLANSVAEKSKRAFMEGQTSILMPINAQQAYMNTRLGYLAALKDYQDAISDLEKAVGSGL
jgi:outer membrane protein, heavy metal efflux system